MKMPTSIFDASDLDQWLVKSSTSKKDPLAAFKKMSLSEEPEQFAPKLFRLPSILTSDNAGTWLVTRKNKNDNNITEEKKTTTSAFKNDNDNSKWLAQPKVEVKVETDVVTLTEEVNPWLVRSSTTTTTNLNALPGTRSSDPIFTLPSQFESKDVSIWLAKSKKPITKVEKENYDDWLWVPQAKMDQKSKSLLDPWLEKSSTMSWTSTSSTTDNSSCKVEEWLKNALDDVTEDFDDCSIEIIADQ